MICTFQLQTACSARVHTHIGGITKMCIQHLFDKQPHKDEWTTYGHPMDNLCAAEDTDGHAILLCSTRPSHMYTASVSFLAYFFHLEIRALVCLEGGSSHAAHFLSMCAASPADCRARSTCSCLIGRSRERSCQGKVGLMTHEGLTKRGRLSREKWGIMKGVCKA